MTTIGLSANDQLLAVTLNPKIASGNQNTVTLHVDFSEDWSRFGKSAVFFTSNDTNTIYEKVLTSGECIVPAEVMSKDGILYIGVRGVNSQNNEVKTTSLVKYKISEGSPSGTGTEVEPTPDVYQQLLTAYVMTDSAIAKEVVDRKAEIAVERARIDNLSTLKEGSTTGDAELLDIRVKADGTTATSAGNAVREQVNELNKDLSNIDENLCEPFKEYIDCEGSENIAGKFINRYTRKPESYPNYNYTVCNCKKGDIFYLHFKNIGDESVLSILVTDESGDSWLQENFAGVEVDYSTEWLKYEITAENASKIYVSSFLTKAVINKREIDKSLVENVVNLLSVVDTLNSNVDTLNSNVDTLNSKIEITLNSAIKNRLGYIDGGACIFSCDDGFLSDETYIFPLINNYDIPFVFAMWANSPILSTKLDEIKNLITTKGCEIAQHYVEDCTGRSVLQNYNLFLEQKNMFKNIGIEIYNMIYPYNAYDENFEKTCSGLYDYACGGGYKNNTSKTMVYELNRIWINVDTDYRSAIDNAIKQNGLVIFGIHSSELADTNVMNVMQNAISYAKNSGIHITTLKGLNNL